MKEPMSEISTGQRLWCSKYALSVGLTQEVLRSLTDDGRYASTERGHFLVIGQDIHVTREAAASKADAMRVKKIKSLKTQIAKLEKLTFAI